MIISEAKHTNYGPDSFSEPGINLPLAFFIVGLFPIVVLSYGLIMSSFCQCCPSWRQLWKTQLIDVGLVTASGIEIFQPVHLANNVCRNYRAVKTYGHYINSKNQCIHQGEYLAAGYTAEKILHGILYKNIYYDIQFFSMYLDLVSLQTITFF